MNYRRRRSAVAEIVGTLVILIATIAIGSVLVGLAAGLISTSSINQQDQVAIQVQQIQERLVVYDVWFTKVSSVSTMILHVYNYGAVDVEIATIYSNLTGTSSAITAYNTAYPNKITISPGYMVQISFPYSYVKGQTYKITVASASGSTFVSAWSA